MNQTSLVRKAALLLPFLAAVLASYLGAKPLPSDPDELGARIVAQGTRNGAVPNLAGLDPLVTYKQLDDFRSGTRLSGPMSAIAQSLTARDYADVAAYFASQPGLPKNSGSRALGSDRGFHNSDPIQKLIFAGDPKRGIAACASCHGPGGYLNGAPALLHQNALYLEQQLQAFAQGTRANDMNMPMRTIAGLLTPDERKSLAAAYSKRVDTSE